MEASRPVGRGLQVPVSTGGDTGHITPVLEVVPMAAKKASKKAAKKGAKRAAKKGAKRAAKKGAKRAVKKGAKKAAKKGAKKAAKKGGCCTCTCDVIPVDPGFKRGWRSWRRPRRASGAVDRRVMRPSRGDMTRET